MTFSDLTIGQVFRLIIQDQVLPLRFRKTEIHGPTNCVSLWKQGHECPAHTETNQEVHIEEDS